MAWYDDLLTRIPNAFKLTIGGVTRYPAGVVILDPVTGAAALPDLTVTALDIGTVSGDPIGFGNPVPVALGVDGAEATADNPVPVSARIVDPFAGGQMLAISTACAVDGSGAPVVRQLTVPGGYQARVLGLIVIGVDGAVAAPASFLGTASALGSGLSVVNTGDSSTLLGAIKSNLDMMNLGDSPALPLPFGAEYAWRLVKTLATPVTVAAGDSLEVTITDDLSGLTSLAIYAVVVLSAV